MQLLTSTKNPLNDKEVRKRSYLKSKTNGSKAVVLMKLDNSQIIMFERPKINLACVLRAWLCCSNVNFLHKIGGKTFLWPSLPVFYLFRQWQVPLTSAFVPAWSFYIQYVFFSPQKWFLRNKMTFSHKKCIFLADNDEYKISIFGS